MFSEKVVKNSQGTGYIYNLLFHGTVCFQMLVPTNERDVALERGRQWFAVKLNEVVN